MNISKVQQSIGDAAKQKQAADFINSMKELHASVFSQATNYANTIILAGYAGAFATWGLTKDKIDNFWTGIIGTLLVISVITFVIFEIYKMLRLVGAQLSFAKSVQKSGAAGDVLNSIETLKRTEISLSQEMMRIWFLCFSVTIITGFGAALILLWKLIELTSGSIK